MNVILKKLFCVRQYKNVKLNNRQVKIDYKTKKYRSFSKFDNKTTEKLI